MATVFLNGVLASTDLDANVVGGTTPDAISAGGALEGGLIKGAQNNDTIVYDLIGQNITSGSVINGNQGNDSITFTNTFPALDSVFRNSTVFGGQGDDVISFDETVRLGLGSFVRGNEGNDTISFVNANGAWINGNQGADSIAAGGVGATIVNTSINGGNGADTITVTGTMSQGWVRGDDGNDSIVLGGSDSSFAAVLINGNAGNDTITVVNGTTFTNSTIRGGDGNDFIDASETNSDLLIFGDSGNDTIELGAGDNTVTGGTGADSIIAGDDGIDTFIFNSGDFVAATSVVVDTSGNVVEEFDIIFDNGVDVITNFKAGTLSGNLEFTGQDIITFNGDDYTAADFGDFGTVTLATDGTFDLTSGDITTIYKVFGSFEENIFAASNSGTDILFFEFTGAGTNVAVTALTNIMVLGNVQFESASI